MQPESAISTCNHYPYPHVKARQLTSIRVLLHAPFGGKEGRLGAWRALVEAQKTGKVRSIGVSNYGIHHLNELEEYINSGVGGQISVGQYEIHPWCPREDIVDWLKKRNIVVEAYSPLVQATRMKEPVLQSLVKKHSKTPAQVLIRWSLQKVCFPSFSTRASMRYSIDPVTGLCPSPQVRDRVAYHRKHAGLRLRAVGRGHAELEDRGGCTCLLGSRQGLPPVISKNHAVIGMGMGSSESLIP